MTLFVGFLVCILMGFADIQYAAAKKCRRFLTRLLPLVFPILVLAFCAAVAASGGYSESVLAENQAFAFFLAVPAVSALVGCFMGLVLARLTKQVNKPTTDES